MKNNQMFGPVQSLPGGSLVMQVTSIPNSPARMCVRQLHKNGLQSSSLLRTQLHVVNRITKFGVRAAGITRDSDLSQEAMEPKSIVRVDLGERSYPIYIGPGLLDNGDILCKHIPGSTALV